LRWQGGGNTLTVKEYRGMRRGGEVKGQEGESINPLVLETRRAATEGGEDRFLCILRRKM